jgi:uncharacterized membrane protein
MTGDLVLYQSWADGVLSGVLVYPFASLPYPPVALVPMVAARATQSITTLPFGAAFSLLALVASSELARLVAHLGGTGKLDRATTVRYAAVAGALAPMILWRYDVFVALLTTIALYFTVKGRSMRAGIVLGLAVGSKLYPVLLLVPFGVFIWRGQSVRAAMSFVTSLAVTTTFVLAPTIAAGGGMPSFISFGVERGVHLESIWGGALALAGSTGLVDVEIVFAHYSQEVHSDATNLVLLTSSAASIVAVVGATLASVGRAAAAARRSVETGRTAVPDLAEAACLVLLALLVTSKVFSPQYLLWVAPFAVLASTRRAALFLAVSVTTSLVYPVLYAQLVHLEIGPVLLLNARNALVLLLALGFLMTPSGNARAARPSPIGPNPTER